MPNGQRQRQGLGTYLFPVMQNIAQMEDVGLLPYQPTPLATLLSGIARGLLPIAMVRQARQLEQERRRQQRLQELERAITQYPAGQVPQPLWQEFVQLAGLPSETPPPPEDPLRQLQREALELDITRARRFMPYEEQQYQLGIQQLQQQLRRGEIDIETAQERLQQLREEREYVNRFRQLDWERAQFETRTLEEVNPELANQLPERLRGLAKVPMWQLAMLNQSGFLGLLTDEFMQPAGQFLSEGVKERLKGQGIDPDRISLGAALKLFPDAFRATRTVRESFWTNWEQLIKQFPFIEGLGDLPATPEIMFSIHDLFIKDEAARRQAARQLFEDVSRDISNAIKNGAPPELIGSKIATHNRLARELGLPEIGDDEARQIIETATVLWNLNVKKQALSVDKLQTDIAKGIVAMRATAANAEANQARARAYIANVASQIQQRGLIGQLAVARETRLQTEAIEKQVNQRWNNEVLKGVAMNINFQGRPITVRFTPLVGWQLLTSEGWQPIRPEMHETISQAVRQKLRAEVAGQLLPPPPPSQQIQPPRRTQQQPSQRRTQTQQQRQAVVGVRRE